MKFQNITETSFPTAALTFFLIYTFSGTVQQMKLDVTKFSFQLTVPSSGENTGQ